MIAYFAGASDDPCASHKLHRVCRLVLNQHFVLPGIRLCSKRRHSQLITKGRDGHIHALCCGAVCGDLWQNQRMGSLPLCQSGLDYRKHAAGCRCRALKKNVCQNMSLSDNLAAWKAVTCVLHYFFFFIFFFKFQSTRTW